MIKRLSWYRFTKVLTYLLAVVMALMAMLLFLLSTQPGSQLSIHLAQRWVQDWVQIETFEGTLLRDFTLTGVTVTLPEGQTIALSQLRLRWRPWQLLQNQVHIRVLDINGVQAVVPASNAEPESISWPIVLPEFNSPIRLRFDHVIIDNADIELAEQSITIRRLQTRGRFEDHQLRLYDLQIESPEGRVQLRATVTPQQNYPVHVIGQLHTELADIGSVDTQFELQGSVLNELNISVEVKGGIGALVQGEVEQLLSGDPHWQFDASLYHLNHPSVQEQVSNFTIRFNGSGDLTEAVGHLLVTGTSHEHGLITLQADGTFAENKAELTHFAINASELGLNAEINGYANITPQALTIAMQGNTQWRNYPQLVMDLNYQGNFNQVDNLLLELKTELGSIRAAGSARWQENPTWDMTIHTDGVQLDRLLLPSTLLPYIEHSLLHSSIQLSGAWGPNRQAVQVNVTELNTTLDGQALSLSGQAALESNQLRLENINVTLGEGSLQLSGQGDFDNFSVKLIAEQLKFDDYSVSAINADLWLDSRFNQLPLGNITVVNLAQEHTFEPLSVDLTLSKNTNYRAHLIGSGDQLDTKLIVVGDWTGSAWQGAVEQLELQSSDYGHWLLNQPTQFFADPSSVQVAPFCLSADQHEAKLCAGIEWLTKEQLFNADLNMNNISLALLEPFLPNTITAKGALDVEAHYSQQGNTRSYHGHVFLHETHLDLPDQDVNLVLQSSNIIELQGNQDRLDGRITINTDAVAGGLTGVFALDSPFNGPLLNAKINLDFASLKIVSLLIPDIQNVSGELNGQFELHGPLMKPAISGQLALQGAGAEVPSAGLILERLNFNIESPVGVDQPFTMAGRVRSGEGELEVTGRYDLATHIAHFDIVGDNFTAMNSREINLVVSPQAQVEAGPNLLRVRGNVTVPKALITPPDFNTVDLASNDTIIVRGEETLWENSSQSIADVDIQMSLGDSFKVEAYGFNGRLGGRIRVIEKPGQDTTAVGNINVESGRYELYGQSLNIDRGTLVFTGGVVSNPGLDLRVSRSFDIDRITVGARVGGSLQEPNLRLFSTPTMQDAEVLSYLIFGRGFGDETNEDQNMLLQASLALGMQGGNLIGERLSSSLGVDDIMLDAGDTLESASLYIGKQLSSRLYVKYGIGLVEPVNTFFIRYRLTDFLSFETQTGTLGSGADLFYSIER